MTLLNIKQELTNVLKEHGTEAFAKIISDSIEESGVSRSQSFTIHKKISDKLIAYSKINITRDE